MDNENPDFEIDPAIAAAMGFSGFGNQNKKRKFDSNDGFVDPDIQKKQQAQGSGANNVPLRERKAPSAQNQAPVVAGGKPTMEDLRHGVRNAKGDVAYFLPSFLEDPWEGLQAK